MKRFLIPLVIAFALALPAQAASGAVRTYAGDVQPSGEVALQLHVKKKGKKRSAKVKGFRVARVPIRCADEPEGVTGGLTIRDVLKVKKRKFGATAISIDGPISKFRAKGRIGKGGTARGTIRVTGSVLLDDGTPDGHYGTNCDTGLLGWTAVRERG